MAALSIRPGKTDDARGLAVVHVKTWQFAYRGQIPDDYLDSMSVERRTARWQEILAGLGEQEQVFVAEVDGEIAGFCVVGRSRDDDADDTVGELYAIYVDAQSMNHGVGSALIATGEAYLQAQGFGSATLWVLESNQRARRFYERKGWFADGKVRQDAVANTVVSQVRYAIRYSVIEDHAAHQ
jgi:ribosomal protein S18 acetylase RimI-like enzyme